MLKRGVANERLEISSKDFIKRFIKNFILNGLAIGVLIWIAYELVTYFITNNIIKELLSFALIFFAINKIHIAAIKDTFYDSYISGDNIRKAKNNVTIFFIVIALVNITFNIIPVIRMYSIISSLFGTSYLKVLITQNIINIVLYFIITIFCRDEIDKQCSELDKEDKHYLIKNIILVLIFAVIVIAGTIFINWGIITSSQSKQNNNSEISNNQEETVNTLKVSSLNKVNCELSKVSNTEQPYVYKDSREFDNGKIEIAISSFDTDIMKMQTYNIKEVKDGVIVCYSGNDEKNYIEKFDINGDSSWKVSTPSKYRLFVGMEVADGYFMEGYLDKKPYIAKINKQGKIINIEYVGEGITDTTIIESEENNKKGTAEVIGINQDGKCIIFKYNNDGKQESMLSTKLTNIVSEQVIKKENFYYGYGADSTEDIYQREDIFLFKMDSEGNEIFKYNIKEKEDLKKYVLYYSDYIDSMTINNEYIYIFVRSSSSINDVYALDLNGNLKEKFGYNTNKKLGSEDDLVIHHISSTDEGTYILGEINTKKFIDKITNDFKFQYRINIPNPKEVELKAIASSGTLAETIYTNAFYYDSYDDTMVIHRYKLD